MGILGLIILLFCLPKIVIGWGSNRQINKRYSEVLERTEKGMRETHKRLAEKCDFAIGTNGMIDPLRYSDGSKRYNPDGSEGAPKGRYF